MNDLDELDRLPVDEQVLAETVETFWEDGDLQSWALLLDVARLELRDRSWDFGTSDYELTLWTSPETCERLAHELPHKIQARLVEVAEAHNMAVNAVQVRRRLPNVSAGWREQQAQRLSADAITNQARAIRDDPAFPREDNLTFRSQEEQRVYRALKRLQGKAPEQPRFGVFPLPSGRTASGTILEPDFLVTVNKRVGITRSTGRTMPVGWPPI